MMDSTQAMVAFREAAANALCAQGQLLEAWKTLPPEAYENLRSEDDIRTLLQLIRRRIYPVNAFAILVRVDRGAARGVLLSRYLGAGVHPDTKFGGYEFELGAMLDDLVESGGENQIRLLLSHPDFDKTLLEDPRVAESICAALDLELEEFKIYVASTMI